jgi:hypothetical protein
MLNWPAEPKLKERRLVLAAGVGFPSLTNWLPKMGRFAVANCNAPALATFSTSCLCIGLRELLAQYHKNGASSRYCSGRISLQKKSAGCCVEAKWSQSRVLPSAELAYETGLSAGSIAVLADGDHCARPPKLGALTRSCTELIRLPSECIAENALRA